MSALTREEILSNGAKFKTKEINIPELGGSVFVREVNAKELDRILALFSFGADTAKRHAECCAYFLSDEKGTRLFGDNQIEMVGRLNAKAMDAILVAGVELNGIGREDAVEQEVKN